MKITLYKAFPDAYRQSMTLYADRLLEAMNPFLKAGETASFHPTKRVFLSPPLLRYWSQYADYALQAAFTNADVHHITDHAYSHLAHLLDPAKTVITFHDSIGLERAGEKRSPFAEMLRSGVRNFNFSGIRRAAHIICDSEASKNRLLHYFAYPPERVHVVYPGVEDAFFQPAETSAKNALGLKPGKYILHVGHNKFYKNIPALFHVLALLNRDRGEKVRLLKVGMPFTAEQEKLAGELGIRQDVIHLGMLDRNRLFQAYHAADVLLFPSFDEGFGFPVLEAMAAGIPVVAASRGSLKEVVAQAGVLNEPQDYPGMAKNVAALLEQPGLKAKFVEAGRQNARRFSWRETGRKTLQVYREICPGQRS